ncbi:Nop19p KNAG_0K00410 [Huiozyma naganishii CBS 8797]|uniref:Nucleolar protein 19 n=1 Tax=Huiozyma naganishii (strain ATCC MYA-139 / BCRC 22969 / CBS 8797 / KCTC 17520 / NBRC 10181 / NCYC 3082 / Yp74L-3) TaxID=1071383 RepID=J7SA06_HUIN7|nr:hypothetical protein KNAG_0K00410 [Kazachstania naganishii CBS 8797]CCK72409.1 hypothetical protein KNAG_0K00410 [Kazachstania naganishii CBS 8797]
MSRAKELQEKLDLQAKLQLAFSKKSASVAAWLEDTPLQDASKSAAHLRDSRDQFFHLPVMQTGSGLNMTQRAGDGPSDQTDIHTVGEFIDSDKKVSSLGKKKRRPVPTAGGSSIHRVSKDDTGAMVALKRKMRTAQRAAIRADPQRTTRTTTSAQADSEDDDDDRPPAQTQGKKHSQLLFQSKKHKRSRN